MIFTCCSNTGVLYTKPPTTWLSHGLMKTCDFTHIPLLPFCLFFVPFSSLIPIPLTALAFVSLFTSLHKSTILPFPAYA